MNASLIPTAVLSLFLVCIILGFLFGWIRGFSKSLVRFIIVLAVTVLAFFVVPSLTNAVLKIDISKLNITIGEVQATTLGDLIIDLLENIPIVQDIIESSPTFESVITLVPQMIANVVLFIVFFFVFKWVSMIIYWIIAGIFFSKKKMADKERHKFIGAVVGTVQGLLIAIVLMVPLYGVVETTRPLLSAVQTVEEPTNSDPEQTDTFVYTANAVEGTEMGGQDESTETDGQDGSETTGEEQESQSLQTFVDETQLYFDAFDNTWLIKVFNTLKIKDLSVKMFDNLTTVKDRDLEVCLRKEVEICAEAYPGIKSLLDGSADTEDPETYDTIKASFNKLYESPTLSGIISEIVPKAASRWTDTSLAEEDRVFCGFPKPAFGDASLDRVFDALLINLRSQTEKTAIQKDVTTTIDVMKICASSGVVSALKGNAKIVDILLLEQNSTLVSDIIDIARQSTTLLDCLPDIINLAMEKVYVILGVEGAPEITVTSDQVDWDTEKITLQNIVNNILKLYDKIDKGTQQPVDPENPNGATKTALDCLDFALLGRVFDGLRKSQLIGIANSKNIIEKLLESSIIVGADPTVLNSFKTQIITAWDDSTLNMESTFVAIQNALEIAKDLENNTGTVTSDNIKEVVDGLKENPALKEVVKEILTDSNTMESLGLDEKTANVVKDTIGAVLDTSYTGTDEEKAEQQAKDIDAIAEIYAVVSNGFDSESEEPSKEETDRLIEAIADSSVIKETLTNGTSEIDLGSIIDETTKSNISSKIDEMSEDKLTETQKQNLKALFGITE